MVGRSFLVGSVLVGLFSWAPNDPALPMLSRLHDLYTDLFQVAASVFFGGSW